jgi:hypothetical protein
VSRSRSSRSCARDRIFILGDLSLHPCKLSALASGREIPTRTPKCSLPRLLIHPRRLGRCRRPARPNRGMLAGNRRRRDPKGPMCARGANHTIVGRPPLSPAAVVDTLGAKGNVEWARRAGAHPATRTDSHNAPRRGQYGPRRAEEERGTGPAGAQPWVHLHRACRVRFLRVGAFAKGILMSVQSPAERVPEFLAP